MSYIRIGKFTKNHDKTKLKSFKLPRLQCFFQGNKITFESHITMTSTPVISCQEEWSHSCPVSSPWRKKRQPMIYREDTRTLRELIPNKRNWGSLNDCMSHSLSVYELDRKCKPNHTTPVDLSARKNFSLSKSMWARVTLINDWRAPVPLQLLKLNSPNHRHNVLYNFMMEFLTINSVEEWHIF